MGYTRTIDIILDTEGIYYTMKDNLLSKFNKIGIKTNINMYFSTINGLQKDCIPIVFFRLHDDFKGQFQLPRKYAMHIDGSNNCNIPGLVMRMVILSFVCEIVL